MSKYNIKNSTKKDYLRRFKLIVRNKPTKAEVFRFLSKIKLVKEEDSTNITIPQHPYFDKIKKYEKNIIGSRSCFSVSYKFSGETVHHSHYYKHPFRKFKVVYVECDEATTYIKVDIRAECIEFYAMFAPNYSATLHRGDKTILVLPKKGQNAMLDFHESTNVKEYKVDLSKARLGVTRITEVLPGETIEQAMNRLLRETISELDNKINSKEYETIMNELITGIHYEEP